MKASVFIAVSLDGFIARPDGDIDWLSTIDSTESEKDSTESEKETGADYGFTAFFESVDALVMGRNTYEKVLTFGEWPYGQKKVIVLTNRPVEFAEIIPPSTEASSLGPEKLLDELSNRGMKHLYIDGGKLIQSFLRCGLIDEVTLARIPVLIGEGIPLFGKIDADIQFRHLNTTTFESGLVQSKYAVVR